MKSITAGTPRSSGNSVYGAKLDADASRASNRVDRAHSASTARSPGDEKAPSVAVRPRASDASALAPRVAPATGTTATRAQSDRKTASDSSATGSSARQ